MLFRLICWKINWILCEKDERVDKIKNLVIVMMETLRRRGEGGGKKTDTQKELRTMHVVHEYFG